MAAGILSKPGSKYGPCKFECKHVDCRETREIATSNCTICEGKIEYETRFYVCDPIRISGEMKKRYDHARCREV